MASRGKVVSCFGGRAGEGRPVGFCGEGAFVAAKAFDTNSLGRVLFFLGSRGGGVDVAEVEFCGDEGFEVGIGLAAVDGFVKALSLFSLSSVVVSFAGGASSCSILLFLGANIVGGLTVGS